MSFFLFQRYWLLHGKPDEKKLEKEKTWRVYFHIKRWGLGMESASQWLGTWPLGTCHVQVFGRYMIMFKKDTRSITNATQAARTLCRCLYDIWREDHATRHMPTVCYSIESMLSPKNSILHVPQPLQTFFLGSFYSL